MTFVHDDPDFADLLRIVATKRDLSPALVEKDYWVTHALWALQHGDLDVWFKGGTSLSKGFGIIERFSEDLDLKLTAKKGSGALPSPSSWTSTKERARASRREHFEAMRKRIVIPGANAISWDDAFTDEKVRSAGFRVEYPAHFANDLPAAMRPFVLLEVGIARVTPSVPRDMAAFVHEHLDAEGQAGDYDDNRPKGVRCVHPLVTLLEKLDSLMKRVPNDDADPVSYVRHIEDAARIVRMKDDLPTLDGYASVAELAQEMEREQQIRELPTAEHEAFAARDDVIQRVESALAALQPMFWGDRIPPKGAFELIREWLADEL